MHKKVLVISASPRRGGGEGGHNLWPPSPPFALMPGHPRLPAGKIHRPPGRAVFRKWAAPARAENTPRFSPADPT